MTVRAVRTCNDGRVVSALCLLSSQSLADVITPMCLLPCWRRVCAVLLFPGRVLLVGLLLDLVLVAYVHEMAPVGSGEVSTGNVSDVVNNSAPSSSVPSSLRSSSPASVFTSKTRPRGVLHKTRATDANGTSLVLSETYTWNDDIKSYNNSLNGTSNTETVTSRDIVSSSRNVMANGDARKEDNRSTGVERHFTSRTEHVEREFPMALVVASSAVAVSILVFFCLSYLWHTRQLDRRAQKLAIRMAAEANSEMNCSQCRPPSAYARCGTHHFDSGSDSGADEPPSLRQHVLDELDSLHEQDELGSDDVYSGRKPGGVGRTLAGRTRGRTRGGFRKHSGRSSKKWSSHSAGQTRSSLITDQEILNHFASRRHSTFFI